MSGESDGAFCAEGEFLDVGVEVRNASFCGFVIANNEFEECGFSASVYSDDAKYFSFEDVKGDVVENNGCVELFGDTSYFKQDHRRKRC